MLQGESKGVKLQILNRSRSHVLSSIYFGNGEEEGGRVRFSGRGFIVISHCVLVMLSLSHYTLHARILM